MEEKIKISLPSNINERLIKDAQNFDFYKNENEINKNLFLNTLIVNYYEQFSSDEKEFYNDLNNILKGVESEEKEMIINKVIKLVSKKNKIIEKDGKTAIVSLKPTKLSNKAIEYINNVLTSNDSIASFYRKLFISYTHKPQNERELIIFKENYNLLTCSINKNVKVCLSLKNGTIYDDLSIYYISSSKDEMYNYILASNSNGTLYTIRLAKIKNVNLLSKKREVRKEIDEIFLRQIKYGVQYPIFKSECESIVVRLTKLGKELFKKIYLYRPDPVKIEDDLYYFDCSYNQVVHYFKRFGMDAIIISPNKVGNSMKKYYYLANKAYKNFSYNDD